MRVNTETYENNICNTYVLEEIKDIKSAIGWAINAIYELPLDRQNIRVEDGLSFDEGTESFSVSTAKAVKDYFEEKENPACYLIAISGDYKTSYITLQIHLKLLKVFLDVDIADKGIMTEIEKLLKLI